MTFQENLFFHDFPLPWEPCYKVTRGGTHYDADATMAGPELY